MLLKCKDKELEETGILGGIIKFDENGFATGVYDLKGERIRDLQKSDILRFKDNPNFSIIKRKLAKSNVKEVEKTEEDDLDAIPEIKKPVKKKMAAKKKSAKRPKINID